MQHKQTNKIRNLWEVEDGRSSSMVEWLGLLTSNHLLLNAVVSNPASFLFFL